MKRKAADNVEDHEILFFDLVASAKEHDDVKRLLMEICTPEETLILIERFRIAKAIFDGMSYREIQHKLRTSSYMISRAKREIINAETSYVVQYLSKLKTD